MKFRLIESQQNRADKIERVLASKLKENNKSYGHSLYLFPDGKAFYYDTHEAFDQFLMPEILPTESMDYYSRATDLFMNVCNCVRACDVDELENYINLPEKPLTNAQYDYLLKWLIDNQKRYRAVEVNRENGDNQFYNRNDIFAEDIIKRIKRYYSSGILYEDFTSRNTGITFTDKDIQDFKNTYPKFVNDKVNAKYVWVTDKGECLGYDNNSHWGILCDIFYEMPLYQRLIDDNTSDMDLNETVWGLEDLVLDNLKWIQLGIDHADLWVAEGHPYTNTQLYAIEDFLKSDIIDEFTIYHTFKDGTRQVNKYNLMVTKPSSIITNIRRCQNGQPIRESLGTDKTEYDSEGNALTKEQSEFFKNSQARFNQSGRSVLEVVYHGTNENFNAFEKGDIGYHFGTDKVADSRKEYKQSINSPTDNWHSNAYYLNIKNPFCEEYDYGDWTGFGIAKNWIFGNGGYESDYIDSTKEDILADIDKGTIGYIPFEFAKFTNEIIDIYLSEKPNNEQMRNIFNEVGYDGISYVNQFEGDCESISYIAFYPEQVKRIDNLNPTNNKNINEDVYDKDGYYNPSQDSRYKRLLRIPINKLTRDDIKYLYTIHFTRLSDGYNSNGTEHCYWYANKDFDELLGSAEYQHGDDFDATYEHFSKLQFPLKVYRALRDDEDTPHGHRSMSWTTDINLYKNERSAFRNCTKIVEATITADMVQNEYTIVNYVCYSCNHNYGRYAESEITLKPRYKTDKLNGLKFINKDDITI